MNQLRAELLRIRSTRTTIGLLLGLIILALLFTILTCTLSPMSQLLTEQGLDKSAELRKHRGSLRRLGWDHAVLPANTDSVLFDRRRYSIRIGIGSSLQRSSRACFGLVFGVIGEGLVFVIGIVIFDVRGVDIVMSGANMTELIIGAIVGTAL